MKIYGIASKRDLGNRCPCCGPWKKDYRAFRKKARQAGRKIIRDDESHERPRPLLR